MIEVTTNNVPRLLIDGYELTEREAVEFDYVDDVSELTLVRYKGQLYDIGEFMHAPEELKAQGWNGYSPDTYFSGTVIRLLDNDSDHVIIGQYFARSNVA